MKNLLENFNRNNFKFLNLDEDDELSLVATKSDGISLIPYPQSNFFNDPAGGPIKDNAIFMYVDIEGDFVARAHVDHDFINTYDAAALMVRADENNWAKLSFGKTDFGTRSIISVVTRDGYSDDVIGANYYWDAVWLQIARKGNVFSTHYSPDGLSWHMTRYFTIKASPSIQIGISAQSPNGNGEATMNFYRFELEKFTVKDIKKGL